LRSRQVGKRHLTEEAHRHRRRNGLLVFVAVLAIGLGALAVLHDDGPQPVALGVATDDLAGLQRFAQETGTRPRLYEYFQAWEGAPPFDAARASGAAARGALPVLTWEPWAPAAGTAQPQYALARIAAGAYDAYLTAYARQVRDWGGTLGIRFAHELSAPHYPWSVGVNGNTPADAIAAWRHVRAVFAREGATRVVWIWCVNIHAPGGVAYDRIYPGDDAVDWVGIDGYNGGTALPWGGWRSPEEVFGDSLADVRELTERPVLLTEVASAEQGGSKPDWIRDLFAFAQDEGIAGIIWFDLAKETDWRVASSPAATQAFRAATAAPGLLGPPPLPERLRPSGAGEGRG
jgi:hypothetical protein